MRYDGRGLDTLSLYREIPAASSFSMPGSEAIFHGFVCTRFHLPELSLPASFMYSSLHCLYEVEANIHPEKRNVKGQISENRVQD